MTPDYVSFANIFIDDIVLPDGRTFMGTLGGAGTHALVGMRVWSDRLGFVASAGADFGAQYGSQLRELGIDLRGVVTREGQRTTRAWQIFEPDDRRIEVFRTPIDDFYKFTPDFEDLPAAYHAARGFHVYWGGTLSELPGFVRQLREVNPTACLVWEPSFHHETGSEDNFRALLPEFALFSPDRDAASAITRQATVEDAMETLLAWGAPLVAIRMGAAGSLLGTKEGQVWRIPAVPATVVDVTGAGNAYCGGFLVGLGEGHGTFEAALRAAVSASFALQQFGVPSFSAGMLSEAKQRLAWAREHAKPGQ